MNEDIMIAFKNNELSDLLEVISFYEQNNKNNELSDLEKAKERIENGLYEIMVNEEGYNE